MLTLGRAGDHPGEYFAGRIGAVRLSNVAAYTANFTLADASGNGWHGYLLRTVPGCWIDRDSCTSKFLAAHS